MNSQRSSLTDQISQKVPFVPACVLPFDCEVFNTHTQNRKKQPSSFCLQTAVLSVLSGQEVT